MKTQIIDEFEESERGVNLIFWLLECALILVWVGAALWMMNQVPA
jgi:hypothetical protein